MTNRGIEALDALGKIRALLSAAQFLTGSQKETELMLDLMNLAEETAARVLEGEKK